jgi:hypothetical protein
MFTDNYRLVRLGMAEAHRGAEHERAYRRRDTDDEPYVAAGSAVLARSPIVGTNPPAAALVTRAAAPDATEDCGPCAASHQAA